ncbi:protein KRI1 homolog [Macadamia integrifolia]|uniref:protein KRI1 homolog n=1 Tax=Macadamia integrifolia TaxID=60698 RepID=UPI001C4EE58C|nr:protein KRI1 homolog [Macadamia integrifolia]
MGLNLFDGSASDDDDNNSKIEINEEFAHRFEHNKEREELQRLEELKKKGLAGDSGDSSSESEEDEDGLIVSGKKDLEFLNALIKVKNRDPILKQKDAKLFEHEDDDDEEEEEEDGEEKKPKSTKDKPMYLKDVVAKQLIEEGPEFEEHNTESRVKSYSEAQEELRQALLTAAEEASDGDDGDLFMEKKGNQGEDGGDAEDRSGDEIQKRLDEYFGKDENLDEKQMFLKNFFMNKMWVDKDDKGLKPSGTDLHGVSEDEEEIEKQEKYEAEYNFRYEEGAGDRVLGHSRITEGSVRKKENARKLHRKSKKERMAQAEFERKEELKHLKNLKKKEIMEKLGKIRSIAGISEGGACELDEDDLEEDFDPEEFDRKMKQMFDEDYYEAEDVDPDFCSDQDEDDDDLRKPNFEKEDELLGLPKGWDSSGSAEGFLAAREKALKCKPDTTDDESSDDQDQKEEELHEGGKRKRKRKISLQDKAWDEYYNLDYEDTIGDIKTRFKYTSVPSKRYGLSATEILLMEDKELNQYVSLKKIAPYQESEWKIPRIKRYEQKMKNKLLLQGENVNVQKAGMKHRSKVGDLATTSTTGSKEKEEAVQLNGEVGTSRGIRRRRRLAELKLSHSRLMAYGKIQPKSKNKKKH